MNVTRLEFGSDAFRALVDAAKQAEGHGRDLSLCVDSSGFKVKVGEGTWTLGFPITEVAPEPKRGEHGDGLPAGFRNPYDSERGLFKGLCKCGKEFWAGMPDEADSLMLNHVEEMANCHHRPGDEPEEGTFCKDCDVKLTWVGPGSADFAPADA